MENDKYNRNVEPIVSFDKRSDAASIQQKMGSTQVEDLKVTVPILKSNGSSNNSLNLLSSQNDTDVSKSSPSQKKAKKKVNFPEDVIVGYHEPPVPWNKVSECSTEDLIAAYRKACMKHDVKPLPKLLQQLHAVVNFHERNETLTFRGESLNIRQCEALEEVLRRVQYRTIDLEASHLDEESAIAMFDMIEYYHSATRLNISYNKIGLRGWQACSRMLKKTHCVEHLDARSCALTEQMVPIFGRALRLGSVLRVLHLENSIMSGRSLMILVAAIKMNEILEDLFVADNKLMPSDGIQLGNLLKFNHKLRLLDVRNNHLGDVGTSHLSEGLFEQTLDTGLQTLVLWNNQVTCQSMHALSRALKNNKNLETLNLGYNNITNEGIHRLKEGLLQNKSLLRIGLQSAKISCEGAVALAECVAESPILIRLDLRENDIKTAGLMALSLALKVNESVHRIDIDQNSKRESGVKDYAEQQRRLLQDIGTYSQRNREAATKREQEEKQRKLEEELQAALTECETVAEAEEVSETQASEISPPSSNQETTQKPDDVESRLDQESLTSDQQQMRLQLNLPLFSRSQSLDSPADPPRQNPPASGQPSTIQEQKQSVKPDANIQEAKEESPIPAEFPPSPMVSSEGKTVHADVASCPAIPLLMEPSADVINEDHKLSKEKPSSDTEVDVKHLGAYVQFVELQQGNLSPVSHDENKSRKLEPSSTPSPTRSPNSHRKFTISRVLEHSSDQCGHSVDTELPGDEIESIVSDNAAVTSSHCDNVNSQAITHKDTQSTSDVSDFVDSLMNNVINTAYSSVTQQVEKSQASHSSEREILVKENQEQNPVTENVISRTDYVDELDSAIKNGASSNSDSCTVDSGVKLIGHSGDCPINNGDKDAVNGHPKEEMFMASKVKDTTLEELSGEKVVNDSVNINGINISVDDFLEMTDSDITGNEEVEFNKELLSSAEDFEKELDDMLASVQTGLAFNSPDGVQAENST